MGIQLSLKEKETVVDVEADNQGKPDVEIEVIGEFQNVMMRHTEKRMRFDHEYAKPRSQSLPRNISKVSVARDSLGPVASGSREAVASSSKGLVPSSSQAALQPVICCPVSSEDKALRIEKGIYIAIGC